MTKNELNVFIGWDKREYEAYDACTRSISDNAAEKENIVCMEPLVLEELKNRGIYFRDRHYPDETVATEFAFSRFLVPFLSNYKGWAVFCDCDFIFTRDISELFDLADDRYSVMCVKHNYVPKGTVKMDGQKQLQFPRKNWSSMMLFNCGHKDCLQLNPQTVATESAAWLHQMQWTDDEKIGEIPLEWNWLVGEYDKDSLNGHTPAVLHYTLGCPFMEGYENCDFAEEYWKYSNPPPRHRPNHIAGLEWLGFN